MENVSMMSASMKERGKWEVKGVLRGRGGGDWPRKATVVKL